MKYRAKSQEIEAMRWTVDNCQEVAAWVGAGFEYPPPHPEWAELFDSTNSSWVELHDGDYVVKVGDGFQRIREDLFNRMYEPIEEDSNG